MGRQREKNQEGDIESLNSESGDEEVVRTGKSSKVHVLVPRVDSIGEVPFDAVVKPEHAESALGHAQATEFDDELLEMLDLDQRAEEEALLKRQVNPAGIDYSCLCWSYIADLALTPDTVGWPPSLALRPLDRKDFPCQAQSMQEHLQSGVEELYTKFRQEVGKPEFP